MLYLNEGLKNTTCSPAFTDVRDGIIQATVILNGGQDTCLLWRTFAAFGLGVDAVSGGPNSTSPTNGFQVPASCQIGPTLTLTLDLDPPPDTRLGRGDRATLTATVELNGAPQAGKTVTFAPADTTLASVSRNSHVTDGMGKATTIVTGEKSGWPTTTTVTTTVDRTREDQAVSVPDVSPVALLLLLACLVLFRLSRKELGASGT